MHRSTQNAILSKLSPWEWGCPTFIAKLQQSFAFGVLWCTSRVLHLYIRRVSTCSYWDEPKPPQCIKCVDARRIHGKTNVTGWHGSGQSHCDDYAHKIAWICTYDNHLEHIPTLQGQKLWLEKVTHVATRVHHTKCTITHIQAYIDIHSSCRILSHRIRK